MLLRRFVDEEFWPRLWRQADAATRPAFMPFASMRSAFDASREEWATQERLRAAWLEPSHWDDTHPSLRDRVEAMGQGKALPARAAGASIDALLGEAAKPIIQEFDRAWWAHEQKAWQSRFRDAQRSKQPDNPPRIGLR